MKKQLLTFSLMLLIVPACKRNIVPSEVVCSQPLMPSVCVPDSPVEIQDEDRALCSDTLDIPSAEAIAYDEQIPAFELAQESSSFDTSQAFTANKSEELLSSKVADHTPGDAYNDSSRYGLKPIYYAYGDYHITDDLQKQVLTHNFKIINDLAQKDYTFSIHGHACSSGGTPDYNIMLSDDRAKYVADYFVKHGINKDQIHTIGFGCQKHIVPSGTKEQQHVNRRVEIYAYPPQVQEREFQDASTI